MDLNSLIQKIEKVSLAYTKEFNIERDSNWFMLKVQEELGELTQSYLIMTGKARTKGKTAEEIKNDFETELADVFCHILLIAKHYDISIEDAVQKKWLRK